MAAKSMSDYKILTRKLYPTPKRVQELIPVFKIGEDGVFQLENLPEGTPRLYDKAYLFEDANFYTLDDYEKQETLKQYCRLLNSMGASFKIVIMNNNRDLEKMRRDLFLRCADTRYADLVSSINEQVEQSVSENGCIEQVRIFVITCRREDEEQARDYYGTCRIIPDESVTADRLQNRQEGAAASDRDGAGALGGRRDRRSYGNRHT